MSKQKAIYYGKKTSRVVANAPPDYQYLLKSPIFI